MNSVFKEDHDNDEKYQRNIYSEHIALNDFAFLEKISKIFSCFF